MTDFYGGSGTSWPEPAPTTGVDWPATDPVPPSIRRGRPFRTYKKSGPYSSASARETTNPAPAPTAPDSGAFPGELLTEAVAANMEDRRVLLGVFRRFAKDESITPSTRASLESFLGALPRAKRLPIVSPDGEGGLTLAWLVQGRGRTLATVADGALYAVGNAGTPQATYLPDMDLNGALPGELLALIPE